MHLSDCFLEIFTFIRFVADSPEMGQADYGQVREDVSRLIVRAQERADDAGYSFELFDQARFAVFAWADETVLCSSWSEVREWLKLPLQREYYGTANAGEEFFERLDVLLSEKNSPESEGFFDDFADDIEPEQTRVANGNVEVLEVYALCLSLGFIGVYFSDPDSDRLARLRNDCIARVLGRQEEDGASVFPAAYGSGEKSSRKPKYRRVFDLISLVFFILPLLVMAGMFFAYRGLLEYSLSLWLG